MNRLLRQKKVAGYTLIELIVILVIVSVLAAIVAPSWLGFLNRQRLSVAQSEAVSAVREAQAKAKQQKRSWEVCIQDDQNRVRWFVRPVANNAPSCAAGSQGPWNNLTGSDADKIAIDTSRTNMENGFFKARFRENGWAATPPVAIAGPDADVAKVTFVYKVGRTQSSTRRCVAVATLLGSLRTGSDNECNN